MNTQQPPREYEGDAGAPLPDFSGARNIQLSTVAPALGVPKKQAPDYLDYDQKGRGIIVTLFANSGMSYLLGITGGGLLGLREGLANAPSSRLRVQLNSILNHCGRHGSRWGNTIGVVSILYSLYEGAADHYDIDRYTGPIQPAAPPFAAFMTGATYYASAGPRVAVLAGSLGCCAVGVTYAGYTLLGKPFGSQGYLFF
mmetsp:Transcript_26324/g.61225  ORF Transcript_26324/g.61225 Transcript_26324/m.61225 type:complete len:199 (-) Transcript_26324:1007-1603(-)